MFVKQLTIRGVDPPLDMRQGPENKTASQAIETWLLAKDAMVDKVSYSGQFLTRNLKEDGSLVISHPEDGLLE